MGRGGVTGNLKLIVLGKPSKYVVVGIFLFDALSYEFGTQKNSITSMHLMNPFPSPPKKNR